MDNFWDGTLWVCVDCYWTHEGDEPAEDVDREPWGMLDDTYQVACGLPEEAHSADCTEEQWSDGGCECEYVAFSWSNCDACGSSLGGARFAYRYKVVS